MSPATFYQWRSKYDGPEASDLKRIKDLEEENRRLKQMYAELSLDYRIFKDIGKMSEIDSAARPHGQIPSGRREWNNAPKELNAQWDLPRPRNRSADVALKDVQSSLQTSLTIPRSQR